MANIRAKQKDEIRQRERHEYDEQCRVQAAAQALLPAGSADSTGAVVAAHSSSSASAAAVALRPLTSPSASSASTPQCDTTLIPIPQDALPPNSSFSPFALERGHLPPLQVQALLDLYVRHGRQTSMESKLGRPHGRFIRQTLHAHDSTAYTPPASEVVSEVLHLVRPVIYTAARAAFHKQPNSWTPWILSLAVDAASRALGPRSVATGSHCCRVSMHNEKCLRTHDFRPLLISRLTASRPVPALSLCVRSPAWRRCRAPSSRR